MPSVVKRMPVEVRCQLRQGSHSIDTTLLALIGAIAEETQDDREIVATVLRLLRSGRVRLMGSFRGRRLDAA